MKNKLQRGRRMNDVIEFPVNETKKARQEAKVKNIDNFLANDPYYVFIRDLLGAISNCGIDLDKKPEDKAREIYAKYERENKLSAFKDLVDPA